MNWNANQSVISDQVKVKRRRHRKPARGIVYRCLVCEDVALNYNFTVITCESCKAFFRRNVDTPNRFQCPHQFSCKVTKQTRKHCPACRLKKCFDIGMRKEILPSVLPTGFCNPLPRSCISEKQFERDQAIKSSSYLSYSVATQYMEAMKRAASNACVEHSHTFAGNTSAFSAPNCAQPRPCHPFTNATSNSSIANLQLLAMMNMTNGRNAAAAAAAAAWHEANMISHEHYVLPSSMHQPEDFTAFKNTSIEFAKVQHNNCAEIVPEIQQHHVSPNTSGADAFLPASPRSRVNSICTLPLHSPTGAFAEQSGAAQSKQSAVVSSLPLKHRLKRLQSSTNNIYESPASNVSSVSVDGVAPTIVSSPLQSIRCGSRISAIDSPASPSTAFDREGVCVSSSALLSADEFKQALETCTRFSSMMQAPFSTAELGALLSNPMPENAFESSVYVELALRRYVNSLKRVDEFARLDRSWQFCVLRQALITAHSVNVGFYTDVERRAFICPREDGTCMYLNEEYVYQTFEKVRTGSADISALMKPLMGFHVSIQQELSTHWTVVLAAMSLVMLFSTHYYQDHSSDSSPDSSSKSGSDNKTALAALSQILMKITGVKLPPDFNLHDVNLLSLAQQCSNIDLQTLAMVIKQLRDVDEAASATSAASGLQIFGRSPAPAGLLETIEPLHRKYLYFLHDYVLMLHPDSEGAATAWRFCSEKLEEMRRIGDVFTQQVTYFMAQNPQLGGLLVPLLHEIISSTS